MPICVLLLNSKLLNVHCPTFPQEILKCRNIFHNSVTLIYIRFALVRLKPLPSSISFSISVFFSELCLAIFIVLAYKQRNQKKNPDLFPYHQHIRQRFKLLHEREKNYSAFVVPAICEFFFQNALSTNFISGSNFAFIHFKSLCWTLAWDPF